MHKESNIQKIVMCALSECGSIPFRNNIGAYKDNRGNYIRYGVGDKGGSDLICATQIEITPEMVGKKVAVFTGVEVKTAKGRIRPEQVNFIDTLVSIGAIAGVVRCEQDAVDLIAAYVERLKS